MPNGKAIGVAFADPEFESVSVTGALTVAGAATVTGALTATGGVTGAVTGNWIMPSATVAATGADQTDAALIATGFTLVSAANGTKGILLPAAAAGKVCIVKNNVAAVLKIWPAVGDAINAITADSAMSIASLTSVVLVAYDATTWYTVPLLPS